jgi:hypothetical protein
MSSKFRRITAITLGSVSLVAAVGAYAYWTNGGSGSGSAATGTNAAITVTQTSTPSGMYPGGAAQGLSGKFNNTNSGTVYVHQVIATIASVTAPNSDVTHPCDENDYLLSGSPATVNAQVASGTAVGSWSGPTIQLLNTVSNQDGCKGATVNVAYASN